MMKKLITFSTLFILSAHVHGQTPTVVIQEDYSNPDSRMYVAGDDYVKRSVENGMYIAKAGKLYPTLEFGFHYKPYNNPQDKYDAYNASDMEFTVVKLSGGSKTDFISIGINYIYLKLSFNEAGEWKFTNYNEDVVYQQGKTEINPGSNQVMFSHRKNRLRCYINGKQVLQYTFTQEQSWTNFMKWENLQVFSKSKKMAIALDQVVLKGYAPYSSYPDEIEKDKVSDIKKEVQQDEKKVTKGALKKFETKIGDKWKYGFKDEEKNEIIPPVYDGAEEFSDGLAQVKQNGKWGFIDGTGKEIVPPKYYFTGKFLNGFAFVVEHTSTDKYGVINRQGVEVVPVKYDFIYDNLLAEGVFVAQLMHHKGFVDTRGKEIGSFKYEEVGKFSDGYARIKQNGKWGFIDKTGKEVIAPQYNGVQDFSEGFAAVNMGGKDESDFLAVNVEGGKWGFIDKTGKQIIPTNYYYADPFSDGVALVQQNRNGTWTIIDGNGKKIPLKYDGLETDFSEGLAVVAMIGKNETKYGVIDKTGKEVIALSADWGPALTTGFSEGLLAVFPLKGNEIKIGYMDRTGKLVIPYTYKEVSPFKNGKAEVKLNNIPFFIDKTGKEIKQ